MMLTKMSSIRTNLFLFLKILSVILAFGFLFHFILRSKVSGKINLDQINSFEWPAKSLPPCGDICTYSGWLISGKNKGYPFLQKQVNCKNIMGRMAWRNYDIEYPPPKQPPEDLYDEFVQYGESPIKEIYYFNQAKPGKLKTYSEKDIKELMKMDSAGEKTSFYKGGFALRATLEEYKDEIAGKQGVVIGTRKPWLEAMLLNVGVGSITTLEYGEITLKHPQIEVYTPYTYGEMYLNGTSTNFDFGVTFSSLEHSGLGRYGDPLNPYGDFEAMAQCWCMLKPGGLFILGVPSNFDGSTNLFWNAHRMYGRDRLMHMTANWELREVRNNKFDNHGIYVLRKDESF